MRRPWTKQTLQSLAGKHVDSVRCLQTSERVDVCLKAVFASLESAQVHQHGEADLEAKDQLTVMQAAGLPNMPEGGLKTLCIDGLLAGLAGSKAWSAAEVEAYELCLQWSDQAVAAWVGRQAKADPGQHPLQNYPVLEPHAMLCKHPLLQTLCRATCRAPQTVSDNLCICQCNVLAHVPKTMQCVWESMKGVWCHEVMPATAAA